MNVHGEGGCNFISKARESSASALIYFGSRSNGATLSSAECGKLFQPLYNTIIEINNSKLCRNGLRVVEIDRIATLCSCPHGRPELAALAEVGPREESLKRRFIFWPDCPGLTYKLDLTSLRY